MSDHTTELWFEEQESAFREDERIEREARRAEHEIAAEGRRQRANIGTTQEVLN